MNLIECYQTHSKWYREALKGSTPIGILWHDTDAGNPEIKRYVQPFEGEENYDEMIALLGKNRYGNDWNHKDVDKGVNAFIGRLADGSVATVKTGGFDFHPWGCGNGTKGSCNGYIWKNDKQNGTQIWLDQHWIQFEICDDGYKSQDYFLKVYKEAVEFTAYLCDLFNIDPAGTVVFNGVTVPTILCHKDSHKLKLGSDHSDVMEWFGKFGKTMQSVRDDVKKILDDRKKKYVVQIGDFSTREYAEQVRTALSVLGTDSIVKEV